VLGYQGQGKLEEGMGSDLKDFPEAQEVYDEADQAAAPLLLGRKISEICFNGSMEDLLEHAQLAKFVVSAAATAVLLNRVKKRPFGVTGHSLGEYGALLASGVFTLKNGVVLVHERQKAMDAANAEIPGGGGMVGVTGLDEDGLMAVASQLDIDVAAINTSTSGTLSGPRTAIEEVPVYLEDQRGVRVTPLGIKGAAHSRWNALAAQIMSPIMDDIEFKRPDFWFFADNGKVIMIPDEIRHHLLNMFGDPVRFRDISVEMARAKVKVFTEVGRDKLLGRFVSRTVDDQIKTETLDDILGDK